MNRAPRAFLAATLVAGVSAAAYSSQSFDGSWAVEVRSEDEECEGLYVMPIEIVDSRIFYVGRGEVGVEGQVADNGAVKARFFNGSELVEAEGEIRGQDFGNGSWVSPTEECNGTWIARKR